MAQNGNVIVDVLSRTNGSVVSQVSGASQTVNLNQLSIVRIHAARTAVTSYERVGNDLVIHMQDGSTVRYHSFFNTDGKGHHSELIFDDGVNPIEHATFVDTGVAPGSAAAIIPGYETIPDVGVLLLDGSNFDPAILGAVLGVVALGAGIAIAANSGGGGGGGSSNNNGGTDGGNNGGNNGGTGGNNGGTGGNNGGTGGNSGGNPGTPPTLTLAPFVGDNLLNKSEVSTPQTFSGSTTNVATGQTITLTINGKTYTTTTASDGTWHVTLPAGDLQGLADGTYVVSVSVTGTDGETITKGITIGVDTTPPTLTVNPVDGDNVIDAQEHNQPLVISGTASVSEAGRTVDILLSGTHYSATVGSDGTWSVTIPANVVSGMANGSYTLTASLSDAAGNTTSTPDSFVIDDSAGTLTVNPISGDGQLNASEAQVALIITGTTTGVATGTAISVTLNGVTYHTTTTAGGGWSLSIPSSALQALADGQTTLIVSLVDAQGDTISQMPTLNVAIHGEPLTLNPAFGGDNILDAAESVVSQTLTGNTGLKGDGQTVTITLGGQQFTGTVGSDGSYTVTVPPSVLGSLPQDGNNIVVTVTDTAGNHNTITAPVTVDTIAPTLTVNPLEGDGYISVAEALQAMILTGTASITEAGKTVNVTINGVEYTGGIVQADGSWSVNIPAGSLSNLNQDVSVVATLTDTAGNTTTNTSTVHVASDPNLPPLVTVNAFSGDNFIDGAEVKVAQILTGSTTRVEAGQVVTITLNGHNYEATVQASGNWSVIVPAADMALLMTGGYTITANVSDKAGNMAVPGTDIFSVDIGHEGIAINPVAGDNIINAQETADGVVISGTTLGVAPFELVTVTFGPLVHIAIVQPDGTWALSLTNADLAGLAPSNLQLTASVLAIDGTTILNNSISVDVDNMSPVPTLNTPFGDGYLNIVEASTAETLSGTTGKSGDGQTVTVTLGGHTYTATVAQDGTWSVSVPSADLHTLPEGNNAIVVQVTDGAGNTATLNGSAIVDLIAPMLTVNPVSGDGYININEATADIAITGTASIADAGRVVTVTLNGHSYSGTVGLNGQWSVTVPAGVLVGVADGQYPLTAQLSDVAGNSITVTSNVQVVADPANAPSLTLNVFAGNNVLDGAEQHVTQIVSGTTTHVEAGQVVAVTLNGVTYNATVLADGSWSASVPAADLAALTNGTVQISAVVLDKAGNQATGSESFTVDTQLSGLSVNPVTGDNQLNAFEASAGITISGSSVNVPVNGVVTIIFNGKTYTATVGVGGAWSAQVSAADLAALSDGPNTISVSATDAAGNPVSGTDVVNVIIHDLPSVTLNPPFGDGILNAAEAGINQTLTGNTGVSGNGQHVTVTLDGQMYNATVAGDGSFTVTVPSSVLTGLGQGPTSIQVNATDVAGNTSNVSVPVTVDTVAPLVSINPVAGDGIINAAEADAVIAVTGTTNATEAGQTVTVSIDGLSYIGIVSAGGAWTVNIPADALASVANGEYTLTASITDVAGNTGSSTTPVTLVADPALLPTVTIATFAGDNQVDGAELQSAQLLSGTTTHVQAGQTVTITLGSHSYTATVLASGAWSVSIPAADLQSLGNGPEVIVAQVNDVAGNPASASESINLDSTLGGISIDTIAGDNNINIAEAAAGVTIMGSTTNVPLNTTVTVLLGGVTYTTTTDAAGHWSIAIPSFALQALAEGTSHVIATTISTDLGTVTTTVDVGIYTQLPVPTINTPFVDGQLGTAEAAATQTLTGTTGLTGDGQTVSVLIDGQTFTGTVGTNGTWTVTIPAGSLSGVAEGTTPIAVTVTDAGGNTAGTSGSVNVDFTAPILTVGSVAGDNVINAQELGGAITLSGTADLGDAGQTVTLQFNGQTYQAIVQPDGTWTTNVPAGALTGTADGSYTLVATLTDLAGNTTEVDVPYTVVAAHSPMPSINTPFGDTFLNIAEAAGPQILSGTTGEIGAGQIVVVALGGTNYDATVDANGVWTLNVSSTILQALAEGVQSIVVTATDSAGNVGTTSSMVTVDLIAPTLTVNPIAGDDIINAAESLQPVIVSGTASLDDVGQTVTVSFNSVNYAAVVQSDGSWSLTLPSSVVQALGNDNYTLNVSITDAAGNTTTQQHGFVIDANAANLPTLTIGVVSGDDYINATEKGEPLVISGTSTHLETGQPVTVNFNGTNYPATIAADGSWTITVQPGDFANLADGQTIITASSSDVAGNPASAIHNVTVIADPADLPSITISPISGDDMINSTEHNQPLVISGTSNHLVTGETITVTLNNIGYPATVAADGTWTITVPVAAVQALTDQPYTVTATGNDVADNVATGTHIVTVDTTPPLLTISVDTGGDNILNAAEALLGLPVSGTGEAGLTVTVTINNIPYTTVVAGNGTWSLTVPSGDLLAITTDGPLAITATATDPAGNLASIAVTPEISLAINNLPTLTLDAVTGDNILNIAEAASGFTITGTSTNLPDGTQVSVNIGGTVVSGTVSGGIWSASVAANLLNTLAEGVSSVTVSVTDTNGNPASASHGLIVDLIAPPVPVINTPFVDGALNQLEAGVNQIITGTTGITGPGQTVVVNVDGNPAHNVTATVGPDGSWSATIPTATLEGLPDGINTVTVTVTDVAGNSNSGSLDFNTLIHALPAVTVTDSFDGLINAGEAALGGSLSGVTGVTSAGQSVIVNINGNNFTAVVNDATGTWTLALPASLLQTLPNGNWTVTVTATDAVGNTSSANEILGVQLTPPPIPTIALPFGDGILNNAEAAAGQTLTGSTGAIGAGQTVSVTFAGNSTPFTATVAADGNWSLVLSPAQLADLGALPAHSITVTSTNEFDNSSTSAPLTFGVDFTTPTPTINSVFGGDDILNIAEAGAAQTITGTTGILGDNQNVKLSIDVNGVQYNATVAINGSWSLTLPAGTLSTLIGADHSVNVTVTDASGNTASVALPFTADFTPPVVAVTSVFSDGYLNATEAQSIGVITGTTDGTLVHITIGGVPFDATVSTGVWTLNLTPAQLATLPQGDQTIVVTATDEAGNTSNVNTQVGIANTLLPTVSVATFAGDNVLDYGESRVPQVLSGTTTHVQQGEIVTITVPGVTGPLTALVQADGSWSLTLLPSQLAGLVNGTENVTVSVNDLAGNTASGGTSFTVDLTPPLTPLLTIDPISSDNIINVADNGNLTLAVGGEYLNAALLQTVNVLVNGVIVGTAPIVLGGDGSWSLAVPLVSLTAFPIDGSYTVTATLVDALNQPLATISETVVVDRTPPTLTVNVFAGDDVLNSTEAAAGQMVSGTASTSEAGRTVTVTLNSKTYTAVVAGDGTWSTTIPAGDLQAVPQGSNNITASISDAAGNVTTDNHTFTTDTSAPLLSLGVVAGDNVINLAESLVGTLLSGTSSGADGQTVTVTLAGVQVGTAVIQPGGAWSLELLPNQLSGLLDGPTILNATVADQAGNITSVDLGLNILFNSLLNVSVVSGLGSIGNTVLNAAGALLGQTLSGTTMDAGVGAVVSVQVGGQTVSANVGANGAWSLVIPPTLLASLTDGPLALNLTVTDAAGNTKVDVLNLDVAKTLPVIGAVTSALGGVDSILNVAESAAGQTVSGAVTAANGTIVSLAVGGQTFTGTVLNNAYSIIVPGGTLNTLADGVVPVILTVTDAAGNAVSQTLNNLTVELHNLPQIVLDPLFGDGLLNAADLLLNQTITGTVKNVAAGTVVDVMLGNSATPLTATVDATGHFTVNVPSNLLTGLLSGTLSVAVSVTDLAGNSANTTQLATVNVALPTLSLTSVLDNGVLNAVDALTTQTISGVVGGVTAGTTVNVTLGGKTFLGVTDASGNFSVTLQPGDLKALSDGTLAIGVSVANAAGNVASISANADVIINQLPKVVLNPVFGGDGILNAAEAALTQTISGTVANAAAGSTVNITVGTLNLTATVDGTGHFTASLAPLQLSQLLNGNISVSATVTDAVGNTSSASAGILVGIHNLPSLVLNPIFGDGVLSVVDLLTGQTISGIATNVAQGAQVQVSLNGKSYTATVGAGGVFSVTVPPLDLGNILDGNINVSASVTDATGNIGSATGLLSVVSQALPTISLNPLFGDGLLNAADALLTQTISGTTTNAVGSTVSLNVGGTVLNALVKADGTFSVSVLPAVLASLVDGSLTVGASVTNAAGHNTTSNATATVGLHVPTLSVGALFGGDGYLNLSEASSSESVSGTSNAANGSLVSVTVGGVTHTGTVTNGAWNVAFSSTELQGIADGSTTVSVNITDAVGNVATSSSPLTVLTHELPLVALNALGSLTGLIPGILGAGLTLSGTSRNIAQGGLVSVTLLGNTLQGTVQADGSWQVKFSSSVFSAYNLLTLLSALLGNIVELKATDVAGNGFDVHVGLAAGSTLPAEATPAVQSLAVEDTHTLAAVHTTDTSTSDTTSHTTTTSTLTEPLATTHTDTSTTTTTESDTTAIAATTSHAESAFSIGGVTIELTATDGVATGGAGNDTIAVHTLDFSHIDGGTGVDTLLLAGTNQHLDLTLLGLKVEHIDIFDLGNSGTNSISLNLNEALNVKDLPNDEVIIKGGAGSLVNLVAGNDGAWSETGQRTVDGLTFDVYHNASLSDTNTLGDVLVQHGLHVQQN